MVFYDFYYISSIGREDEQLPDHSEQFCPDNSSFMLVNNPPHFFQDDRLNAEEKELNFRTLQLYLFLKDYWLNSK